MKFVPDAPDPGMGVPMGIDQRAPEPKALKFVPDQSAAAPTAPAEFDAKPAKIAGFDVPASYQQPTDMITSAAQGANKYLAKALAIPINDLNVIMGQAGHAFLQNGDAEKSIKDAMEQAGMGAKTKAVYPFMEHIGTEAMSQMLAVAATLAGGPAMAATEGAGTLAATMRAMGKFSMERPGTAIAGALGSSIAGPTGGRALPAAVQGLRDLNASSSGAASTPNSPALNAALTQTGEVLGGIGGAFVGGGVTSMARPGGIGLRAGGAGVADAMGGKPSLPVTSLDADMSPLAGRTADIQKDIVNRMTAAYDTVHTADDTVTAAQKLREAVRTASGYANKQIAQVWKAVDQTKTMESAGLKALPAQLAAQIANPTASAGNLPDKVLSAISKLPAFPELRNVREIMTEAMQEIRRIPKIGEGANDTKKKFLSQVVDTIKTEIDKSFPDDPAIQQASNLTKWFHDTFDRSALAPFAQRRVTAEAGLRDAVPGANRLVNSETGGQQIAGLQSARPMTGETDVTGPAENFIRAQLGNVAETKGPTKGVLWLQSPAVQRFIKSYPAMDAMAQKFTSTIQPAIDEAMAMANSKFFARAGQAPDTAVNGLFQSAEPAEATRYAVRQLGPDPQAMDALHAGIVTKMINDTKLQPQNMARWISQARNRSVLEEAFANQPSKLGRLHRIIDAGISIGQGEENAVGKATRFGSNILGRIVGSTVFNKIIPLPGNELIKASAGAKLGRGIADRLFRVYTPEQLMFKAIQDPRWEAFLFSKVPTNLKDFRQMNQRLAQLAGVAFQGFHNLGEPDQQEPIK
jgi:hypothetical protein